MAFIIKVDSFQAGVQDLFKASEMFFVVFNHTYKVILSGKAKVPSHGN